MAADERASPITVQPIPAQTGEVVLSFTYGTDANGPYVDMVDDHVVGWLIDASGANPVADPITINLLPPAAPGGFTGPVPQWAAYRSNQVIVPDAYRGELPAFMDWIGAGRMLRGTFVEPSLRTAWNTWAGHHPDQVWSPS
jgi:hypothetical protein